MFPVPATCDTESVEHLSLELITLNVKSIEAETVRGVRVTVSGTCQVKVDAFTQDDLHQNLQQITLACQHFLGKVSYHVVRQDAAAVHAEDAMHSTATPPKNIKITACPDTFSRRIRGYPCRCSATCLWIARVFVIVDELTNV